MCGTSLVSPSWLVLSKPDMPSHCTVCDEIVKAWSCQFASAVCAACRPHGLHAAQSGFELRDKQHNLACICYLPSSSLFATLSRKAVPLQCLCSNSLDCFKKMLSLPYTVQSNSFVVAQQFGTHIMGVYVCMVCMANQQLLLTILPGCCQANKMNAQSPNDTECMVTGMSGMILVLSHYNDQL